LKRLPPSARSLAGVVKASFGWYESVSSSIWEMPKCSAASRAC
jgi:hypothetical protein